MSRLPVIVGLGGVNPAGRLSAHHAYRRLVLDRLPQEEAEATWRSLGAMMQLTAGELPDAAQRQHILDHTLVRRIEPHLIDVDAIPWNRSFELRPAHGDALVFRTRQRLLPDHIPDSWSVRDVADTPGLVEVSVAKGLEAFLPDTRVSKVQSAGQLPTGFHPESLYQSRSHPRGLAMTIYGASDAVRSLGMDWETVRAAVRPDEVAVYAGSGMGQLDFNGSGGMLQSQLIGKRVTAKQCALGLAEMPADFINAYILGSVGSTGTNLGACATFLYNLRQGIDDIRTGKRRVVFVGNAEAPVTPEIIEGYRTMGALAEDEDLMRLDGRNDHADHRRACRPFSSNCGFTLAESAVFTVLMDDALAVELGAEILGAVADVFVNADGFKKSIPGPGVGNYLTIAKALATGRAICGEDSVRRRSYIQAHGTSTPQNRVTESHIFSEMAKVFGIDRWTVGAVKAYLGHSLAPASGDQFAVSLGAFAHGIIPGITTIDHIAEDVHTAHLDFPMDHVETGEQGMDMVFLNSKGFGGNNATGLLLAPHVTRSMLAKRHGAAAMKQWQARNEKVSAAIRDYDEALIRGEIAPIYRFGEGVLDGPDLSLTAHEIRLPGFAQPVDLDLPNPYPDMSS